MILATTKPGATRAEVQIWMKINGASEIMYPASVIILDAIPLLGSGKTNYLALAKALRESGVERNLLTSIARNSRFESRAVEGRLVSIEPPCKT